MNDDDDIGWCVYPACDICSKALKQYLGWLLNFAKSGVNLIDLYKN